MAETTPDVSIVVPVYNEEANLRELYSRIVATIEALGKDFEIVVVNDGSRDGSLELLRELHASDSRLRVVNLMRNFGQNPALYAGFSQVRGRYVVMLDADLQNPPEEIPKLLAKLDEGYDVATGWRVERRDSPFRLVSSRILNAMVARITRLPVHDHGCALKAFRREVVDQLSGLFTHRSRYLPTEVAWLGVRIAEVEVAHHPREKGTSKYSILALMAASFDLLTSITSAPLEIIGIIGWLFALIGMFISGVVALRWLFVGAYEPFVVIAGLFLFLAGVQLIATGFMCEYIGRIFKEVQNKPYFVIKEVIE
ncbi:MAG TPA: glycosyltransferase [Candidatus Hydrogenedentes bacterium]|nr:glycosyltransferase [Candidatus Hydrogenedentota bacterium]HPG68702.1 glycosyltransferase [Candidatus Hydrogenedentota bacterium]